jgi:chromatin modification-related protein VID21
MQAMQNQQQRMNPQGGNENLHRMMVQQRAQQQYQTQMQHGGNNLAVAHLGNAIQNPQMIAAMQAAQRATNGTQNGLASPSMAAASPRPHPAQNQLAQQPQQLSSGHTPTLLFLQQQVAAQFPHFNATEVQKLAHERLQGQVQLKRMQASALSAASGSPAPMGNLTPMQQMSYNNAGNGMNGMLGPHSPTQYQQQLHRSMQQQQQQAAAARLGSGSPGMSNAGIAGSRSATPNGQQGGLMMQRTASGTPMGEDGSPRLMQAQMARP